LKWRVAKLRRLRDTNELGLDAFMYTVEPKEAGWELRVECGP
jgi:hypothetical protein